MNIVVCLKQTFDTEAKIVLDGSGNIDSTGVEQVINPYDEFAIEEALQLKEKFGGEVTVVSMGPDKSESAIRTALAMGCEKGVLINDPEIVNPDEWATAEVLAKAISQMPYDVILVGRIAVDFGSSQVGVRLADLLEIPSVSSILNLEIDGDKATVTREIDGGTEVLEINIPAVLTAQKGLNIPRYPSMMGIMKAKKKEVKVLSLADLGISASDLEPKMTVQKFSLPKPRTAGTPLTGEPEETAAELAKMLREEAKVI